MKIADAMNRLQREWDETANRLAEMVGEDLLTADEAVKCLLGHDLKIRDDIRSHGFEPGPGHSLPVARQAIDSRLPGYQGLVVDRHI